METSIQLMYYLSIVICLWRVNGEANEILGSWQNLNWCTSSIERGQIIDACWRSKANFLEVRKSSIIWLFVWGVVASAGEVFWVSWEFWKVICHGSQNTGLISLSWLVQVASWSTM